MPLWLDSEGHSPSTFPLCTKLTASLLDNTAVTGGLLDDLLVSGVASIHMGPTTASDIYIGYVEKLLVRTCTIRCASLGTVWTKIDFNKCHHDVTQQGLGERWITCWYVHVS